MKRIIAIAPLALVMAFWAGAETVDTGQWINLFDGESLFGFDTIGDAEWHVRDGVLTCTDGAGGMLATSTQFGDFELSARIRVRSGGEGGLVVRAGLDRHHSEDGSAAVYIPEDRNEWREVRVVVRDRTWSATVDGEQVDDFQGYRPTGHIAILYPRRSSRIEVAELKLRPLGLTPLFNGQDLEGWNVFPGRRSKFQVVDGALNITDGNGQIETEGVYKDFMVQMKIISNGDHLNSGVFFRGPRGVFWKGYESQVRNEWRGDDRARPVDFGTGGLYGIQPARKVVSTDYEWFDKTIVCVGNQMAVWINGYQVSNFTDTRPVNEEGDAKQGYVPGPGTIHLQGHDPTTDLSFKDMNIQVYPEK